MFIADRRTQNIEIFKDTEKLCKTNPKLKNAITESTNRQYVVKEGDVIEYNREHRFSELAQVIVSKKRSLEAARAYSGQKVCVHNFASATNPGGGVTKGSSAQEEAICRCSTLYFNINESKITDDFYVRHRQMLRIGQLDARYNDDCIYTPGVVVFKEDTAFPKRLQEKEWYQVDVITCAAPNLRERTSNMMNPDGGTKPIRLKDKELKDIHEKRMRRIFDIAKKEKVDVLILGAFGCGAFQNSPRVVADAMATVVKEYQYDFAVIEFAVYCPPGNAENHDVFKRRLLRD